MQFTTSAKSELVEGGKRKARRAERRRAERRRERMEGKRV